MSNHTQNDTQGAHTDRHTITPPGVGISPVKSGLTSSIPMGISAVGRVASDENIQNINFL